MSCAFENYRRVGGIKDDSPGLHIGRARDTHFSPAAHRAERGGLLAAMPRYWITVGADRGCTMLGVALLI